MGEREREIEKELQTFFHQINLVQISPKKLKR
jgi:hypothetical protein